MKKLLSVLVVLGMLLSLTGCGDDGKIHVGVVQLIQHSALDQATQGFVDVLNEEFGDEIVIDVKVAAGDSAACATIANGFVSEDVDLIMANATPALQAAAAATNSIPVLGTSVTEYGVALGIDNFSGVTGTNVSGTSDLPPLDEQAQMVIDLVPDAKKVGIIYCTNEANSVYQVEVVSEYLKAKGLDVVVKTFSESNEIAAVASQLADEVDVIYAPTDNQVASCAETINNVLVDKKMPVISGDEGICAGCGVATLAIDYYELGRTTGEMAVKILKGEANVSEMPIEYYPNPVKKYNAVNAANCGIEVTAEFTAIE